MKKKLSLPARDEAINSLVDAGIQFETKEAGVAGSCLSIGVPVVVHFWPSSQRWNVLKSPHNGKGIEPLVTWLKQNHPHLIKEKRNAPGTQ